MLYIIEAQRYANINYIRWIDLGGETTAPYVYPMPWTFLGNH